MEVANDLEKIVKKYKPDEASVEDLFFFKNAKTVIKVSQARGAILLTLEQNCVNIFEYTPLQVKQALTGYGRAEKKQIQQMTRQILNLKEIPKPDDTADAIAVALCHINSRKVRQVTSLSSNKFIDFIFSRFFLKNFMDLMDFITKSYGKYKPNNRLSYKPRGTF